MIILSQTDPIFMALSFEVLIMTISKTRSGHGKRIEEKAVPDSGCTVPIIPLCIVKDHGLQVVPLDRDEPGMKGFGDHSVPLVGQTSFWYKAR